MGIEQTAPKSSLVRVLNGERVDPPPIWMMRQAGRYLPEYRELRARFPRFLDLCYAPAAASEVTLQPLKRFDLDAAILFCDILVIPDALGRKVEFVAGDGPRLEPLIEEKVWRFDDPARVVQRLGPVYENVARTRAALAQDKALIGFAGGPWTVATYMLQGEGGDKLKARRAAYQRPEEVDRLLDTLVEATALHLEAQARAGADALKIFESWAGGLAPPLFERLILRPTKALVAKLRAAGITQPIIGFPREAGSQLARYAAETGVTAVALDTAADPRWARTVVPPNMALQGNMDPDLMVLGGEALARGARETVEAFRGGPHIFNLGHGITPQADPENVAALIRAVKAA
ncbi:MAG TPA: uroporphyrinogen decarboxylase [Caulobacterales bacterium]|jgi:uroporphyrinogen decarboxylase|nr:uroporphyrinogen decarboxylase [Caulobacterales bacterium]